MEFRGTNEGALVGILATGGWTVAQTPGGEIRAVPYDPRERTVGPRLAPIEVASPRASSVSLVRRHTHKRLALVVYV